MPDGFIRDRLVQLTNGLQTIRAAQDMFDRDGAYEFEELAQVDGRPAPVIDAQVIQAMKGAVVGVYRIILADGNEDDKLRAVKIMAESNRFRRYGS